jgi:hypothetical protein
VGSRTSHTTTTSSAPLLPCLFVRTCAGPPADVDTVLAMFDHVRQQWPGARVQASTLESYLDGLTQALEAGGLTLPVVTGEGGLVVDLTALTEWTRTGTRGSEAGPGRLTLPGTGEGGGWWTSLLSPDGLAQASEDQKQRQRAAHCLVAGHGWGGLLVDPHPGPTVHIGWTHRWKRIRGRARTRHTACGHPGGGGGGWPKLVTVCW